MHANEPRREYEASKHVNEHYIQIALDCVVLFWIDNIIKTIIACQMEVWRYNSPRRVASVRARMHRQRMQGGKAFPLEHPLSLITSDYRLSERDDQSRPATALMTNVFLSLSHHNQTTSCFLFLFFISLP